MDLEVRPNNDLKYRRNFCQAIFGLLQLAPMFLIELSSDMIVVFLCELAHCLTLMWPVVR